MTPEGLMTRFHKPFLAALLLAALGSAGVGLATGVWMAFSDVPGFGGEEANVVYTVQQLVAGQPIYTDPARPPFTITQYSPLYYVVAGGLARCLGVEASDPSTVTMLCRLVSLSAALAVALLAFALTTRRLGLSATVGLLVACFAFVSAVPWHFLARPDALMSLFLLGAIYLALGVDPARAPSSHAWAAGAVVVAFLALLTKQNGVQALGLVFLCLLLRRAWKELATATLSAAAVLGLLVVLAAPLQRWLGPALKENLIDGVRNGVDLLAALDRAYVPFFRQFSFVAALTGVAAVAFLWTRCPTRRFLGLATLLLFVFACGTAVKTGSALNYFLDFLILGAATSALYCCPSSADKVTRWQGDRVTQDSQAPVTLSLRPLVLAALLFFLPFAALDQFERCCYAKSIPGTLRPDPRHQFGASGNVAAFVRDNLREADGALVLTGECFSVGNLLFPFTAAPQPRLAEIAHARGVVDYKGFRSCVERGKVCYVVTKAGTQPSPFLGAPLTRYRLVREVDGFAVFEHVR
jgi:hypothetical protein